MRTRIAATPTTRRHNTAMAHLQRSHLARLALLAAATNAQFPGMPGGPPADARPIFKTGKYLGCTVCKLAVEEIWKEALRLREEAPYKKPSEDMYQDSIQQICDPIKDLGEWVAMYDITQSERGAPLKMEKQEYMCECRRECRTIQKACENIVNEHMEDMAESLYKRDAATLEKFSNRVCTCVEINQCVGCTRQFFTKSFLGDDAADLARSSGEEPASPRHRAGVASMARRTTRRFSTNAP